VIARPRLVLASASPRRAALLGQAVIKPDEICAPEIDETPKRGELPRDYVRRMANEKAMTVARLQDNAIVLAADTVVACGRRILPKAESDCEVESCLKLLSGRRHRVLTAVTVASEGGKKIRTRIVTTQVSFKRISANEISHYVSSKEGLGKAGGYAIQGLAETFARRINGSYSNIVGLPLAESLSLLAAVGYQTH
jgi:septum formation protein